MAEATVTFDLGAESVTSIIDIVLDTETILTGDIGGLIPAGTVARLRGACRLIADLHVRGTLLCDPTGVDLDGQDLYDIHTHDGTLNLVGVEKTAWTGWGGHRFVGDPVVPVVGWEVGDRLSVAPTVEGVYNPIAITWGGSWAATPRPVNSPPFTLRDGRVIEPEVANLDRTVTLRRLTRVMFHEATGPNPQTLKWIRVLDSGKADTAVLAGFYPIHFHLLGDNSRGSLIEGVVVEGGKQYAFVPHGSHGVTFKDCAAVNTFNDGYWWDAPGTAHYVGGGLDPSDDIIYDRCLALGIKTDRGTTAGFRLAEGLRNRLVDCAVAAFPKPGADGTGAHWRFGTDPWEFSDFVAHNIEWNGLSVWQNDQARVHLIERIVTYNCGHVQSGTSYGSGFDHGAYGNLYHYRDIYGDRFRLHAKSESGDGYLTIEQANLLELEVVKHQLGLWKNMKVIDSTINVVRYNEPATGKPSWIQYENCGLTPEANFQLDSVAGGTVIEVFEGGVLQHRWASGVWS